MVSQASTSAGLSGGTASTRQPHGHSLFGDLVHAAAGGSTRHHGLRLDATDTGSPRGLDGVLAGLEGIP